MRASLWARPGAARGGGRRVGAQVVAGQPPGHPARGTLGGCAGAHRHRDDPGRPRRASASSSSRCRGRWSRCAAVSTCSASSCSRGSPGLGGGIIRDLFLGITPPVAVSDWQLLAAAVAAAVLVFLLHGRWEEVTAREPDVRWRRLPYAVRLLDAGGLADLRRQRRARGPRAWMPARSPRP